MNNSFRLLKLGHFNNIIKRFRTATLKQEERNYLVLRAAKEDFPCILQLMETSYYPEEPTCSSLALRPNAAMEDDVIRTLSEGLSLIAKCKYTGDILAACINETTNPWDPDMKDKLACNVACEKFRHLLHFYAYLQRVPELWKKFCVQKVFEMEYLFVRRDQRGKGLALRLMQDSRILAADCGYTLIRCDATSHYTSKLCEKMKMKMVYEIPYCSYLGSDQTPIFKPRKPHISAKVYIDDSPQESVLGEKSTVIEDKPHLKKL